MVPEEDWKHRTYSPATLSGLKSVCRDFVAGKAFVCVFVGESGSGKALAAEMIAKETDQILYRIDLAAVISKYINETEKKLQKLLARAEGTRTVLFFDEADALFASRDSSPTRSDRVVPQYVSILDSIDRYPGMVIIATSTRPDYRWLMQRKYRYIIDFHKKPPTRSSK